MDALEDPTPALVEAVDLACLRRPEDDARLRELYELLVPADRREHERSYVDSHQQPLTYKNLLRDHFTATGRAPLEQLASIDHMQDAIIYDHLLRSAMGDLLAEGRFDEAEALVDLTRSVDDGLLTLGGGPDTRWRAHRVLLLQHAADADVAAFTARLPRCNGRSMRHELDTAKLALVEAVERQRGWEAALAVCQRRPFGERFQHGALRPHVMSLGCAGARDFFDARPDLDVGDLRVMLTVETFVADEGRHEHFDEVFALVAAMEVETKNQRRGRDWLFMTVGLAVDERERIGQCRRAVVNPSLKKELTMHEKLLFPARRRPTTAG